MTSMMPCRNHRRGRLTASCTPCRPSAPSGNASHNANGQSVNTQYTLDFGGSVSKQRTEVVRHQQLVLQRMLGADSDNGLVRLERPEARTSGPSCRAAPCQLLLQDVEERHDISQTAAANPLCQQGRESGRRALAGGTCLCSGTLPYVTDSITTSSSSGEALRASSMARTSSTPAR